MVVNNLLIRPYLLGGSFGEVPQIPTKKDPQQIRGNGIQVEESIVWVDDFCFGGEKRIHLFKMVTSLICL